MFRAGVVAGGLVALAIVAPSLAQQAAQPAVQSGGLVPSASTLRQQPKALQFANLAVMPRHSPSPTDAQLSRQQTQQQRDSDIERQPVQDGVQSKIRLLHYSFGGRSQAAATRNYLAAKPQGVSYRGKPFRAAAQTTWRLAYRTKFHATPVSCAITSIEVVVPVRYMMPRWLDYERAGKQAQRRWDKFYQRLFFHEQGHGKIALAGGQDLYDALAEIGTQPDCNLLRDKSRKALGEIRAQTKQRQRAYDRRTNHGIRQGVGFPFRS